MLVVDILTEYGMGEEFSYREKVEEHLVKSKEKLMNVSVSTMTLTS